jgi:hypothetical protein
MNHAGSLKRGGQTGGKVMKKWSLKKIVDGRAEYTCGIEKVVITEATNAGCFNLKLYRNGEPVGKAFWHGGDMEIDSDFVTYFGADDFADCLNYVEWE